MQHVILGDLDAADPHWSHAITAVVRVGEGLVVAASLTFRGSTRAGLGWGTPDEAGVRAAERAALDDAAEKFSERFRRSAHEPEAEEVPGHPGKFTGDPKARSGADRLAEKQLEEIRLQALSLGLDPDQEARRLYHVPVEWLSKAAASHFTRHLRHEIGARTEPPTSPPASVSKPEDLRQRRGRAIGSLPGAVVRGGDHYVVTIKAVGGPDLEFTVSRGEDGRPRCTCPDFERHKEAGYRCEHIFAVAHFTSINPEAASAAPTQGESR